MGDGDGDEWLCIYSPGGDTKQVVVVVVVVVGLVFETVGVPGPASFESFQASEAFRAWSRASAQTIAL